MVAQLGQLEKCSVCSKMHEVWAVKLVWDANATPGIANCPHHKYWIMSRGSSFMRCLVVVQHEGLAVLCSLINKMQNVNQIAGTRVYISVLPAPTSTIFISSIEHTGRILNYFDITWLAQDNPSRSKTHQITYTTLKVHSALPFARFNFIIMLMPPM